MDRRPGADRRRGGAAAAPGGSPRPRPDWPRCSPAATHELATEELALRARLDLDEGRTREAALQVLVALDAALAELAADPAAPALVDRLEELRGLRDGVAAAARAALGPEPLGDPEREATQFALGRIEAALRARAMALPGIGSSSAASTASSSSTTSPPSRTAAWRSNGVRLLVTIAIWPPFDSVVSGSCATGYTSSEEPMHSIRSAPAASASACVTASAGRYSPNSTTSGFSGAPQSHRGTPSGAHWTSAAHVSQFIS